MQGFPLGCLLGVSSQVLLQSSELLFWLPPHLPGSGFFQQHKCPGFQRPRTLFPRFLSAFLVSVIRGTSLTDVASSQPPVNVNPQRAEAAAEIRLKVEFCVSGNFCTSDEENLLGGDRSQLFNGNIKLEFSPPPLETVLPLVLVWGLSVALGSVGRLSPTQPVAGVSESLPRAELPPQGISEGALGSVTLWHLAEGCKTVVGRAPLAVLCSGAEGDRQTCSLVNGEGGFTRLREWSHTVEYHEVSQFPTPVPSSFPLLSFTV